MRFEKSHKRVIFKTNYGFRRVLCVSYWRWMRRCVVWNRKRSKYNIWLWFIQRFPSWITAGNEDFIGIFRGTKSSGFFFKEANHIISELHTWILATICPHGCAFKPIALYCHWISSALESLRRGAETCLQILCIIIQVRIWFWFNIFNASLLSGVAGCALCVCVPYFPYL